MSRPVKRRRLSPESEATATPSPPPPANHRRKAPKWDAQQDYEERPRRLQKKDESSKLPIRTTEGWAEHPDADQPDKDEDSFLGTGSEDEGDDAEAVEEEVPEAPKVSHRQQVVEAKEELARLAALINEDPEEHASSLRSLAKVAGSPNFTVKKLALAAQLAVYKDMIPGYRIRPLKEEDLKEKLSKEVRKLRNFEQAIVGGYQVYVKELAKYAKGSRDGMDEQTASLASVAISCACTLLTSVPHFNFRSDLIKILVGKISTRTVDADFRKCLEAFETLFREDEDGNAALDAVTLLMKMIKGKHYRIDESVLNTFLHLRLLSEFAHKASHNRVDRDDGDASKGKQLKHKKEFRTKRMRKAMREQKTLQKEFNEADATVSHEEKERMQSEILKLVFATYFRILKARVPSLMGAVLEGLAKYSHLINQDFFGDILEALKDMIAAADAPPASAEGTDDSLDEDISRNPTRESLLCVITAFALLQGQDAHAAANTLHLDLSFFITHLYRTLYPVSLNPDVELNSKSLHLPDPDAPDQRTEAHKVNVQTTIVLLLRSLTSTLLPPTALRAVPATRIAAFSRAILTASLQLPEKSCLAMVGLMNRITKVHGKKIAAMWYTEERKGDGVFNPLSAEIDSSNPFAGTVWESELLKLHFSQQVREGVAGMEKNVVEAR